jgi:isopenicillin-N N-acyltransferase like protein
MSAARFLARHRRKVAALAIAVWAPVVAHLAIDLTTGGAPAGTSPIAKVTEDGAVRRASVVTSGWSVVRGVRIVHLRGDPAEIGAQHAKLLRDRMVEDEKVLWDGFEHVIPFRPARILLFDVARVRYRDVDRGFPEDRRREILSEATNFEPDPYSDRMPTYRRMAMLHALYDIALGFEHSPLIGCTAFGLGPEATSDGHALFARAFDFEAAEVFDRDKVVFIVHERSKIPFASVAWPGFVGVVTGMNAKGVAIAVHGGRAREPSTTGIPVAFSLREVLANAHDTEEATRILASQDVMVSHIVFVGDASGRFAVVERAPGIAAHVRSSFASPGKASVTNHFEGPLANDPRDDAVRRSTSTLARRKRIDELLAALEPKAGSVSKAVALLRDHECAGGEACPAGDRRAIDAFIATHGVVADLTEGALWVSAGPHLSGKFVKIPASLLVPPANESPLELPPDELETIPEDPALHDGRYVQGRRRVGPATLGDK